VEILRLEIRSNCRLFVWEKSQCLFEFLKSSIMPENAETLTDKVPGDLL